MNLQPPSKPLTLYRNMCTAIAQCHEIDDCKDIVDKSVGLSAYYEQIKDTETERMFYQVKLRAWRRIGELFSAVDLAGCETQSSKTKKIRENFAEAAIREISDSRIIEILKLMAVPDASFEVALTSVARGSIPALLCVTPEAIAESEARHAAYQKQISDPKFREQLRQEKKQREDQAERGAQEAAYERHLLLASEEAHHEVGITLDRRYRASMKHVVFLIKEDIHDVMRKAAFDEKITMQEVLRRGLKMWLIAHGYDFPDDPPKKAASGRNERQGAAI